VVRITYVTHTRFPSQRGHGKQIAEVCAAMAALGHRVTLLCPGIANVITRDAFSFYGLKRTFQVEPLSHFDATHRFWIPGIAQFRVNMWFFRRALRSYLKHHRADLLYARSPLLLPVLLKTRIPVILELHELPRFRKKRFAKRCNRCARVVCLTKLMRDELAAGGGQPKRVVVEPDGVDLERFREYEVKESRRSRRSQKQPVPVVGYVGSFFTRDKIDKGVVILLEALALLKRRGVKIRGKFSGGWGDEAKPFVRQARLLRLEDHVQFDGFRPASLIPLELAACTVLIYPAPASKHPYFQRDTSPLKLFEYLAAGKPIVCADLPPLREVVSKGQVFFFTPGDAGSLAHWIAYIIDHPKEAAKRAAAGKRLVQRYDWKKRMERILRAVPAASGRPTK